MIMWMTSCSSEVVVSDFCGIYEYERYSETTKDFWRTYMLTDNGVAADRLRTGRNQKAFRCLCPDNHNEGTEGCPD